MRYKTRQRSYVSKYSHLRTYDKSMKISNSLSTANLKIEFSYNLTLFTCMTIASRTSPLNGLNTIALYFTGYTTNPWPGCTIPAPILSIVVTAITNPYLKRIYICLFRAKIKERTAFREKRAIRTHFPVQVPSTSVYNFCFTVSYSAGPKYLGCNRISCSNAICE